MKSNSKYNFTLEAKRQIAALDRDLGKFSVEVDLIDERREMFSSMTLEVEGELANLGKLVENQLFGSEGGGNCEKLWITGVEALSANCLAINL